MSPALAGGFLSTAPPGKFKKFNEKKKKNPGSPGLSSPFLAFPPLTEMEARQICAPTTTAVTRHIPEMKTAS